jgi:hypothetical protein
MPNSNRNRVNQPPSSAGKKQSRTLGAPEKLGKRSEVAQAQRGHSELNIGTTADEAAPTEGSQPNPRRMKAGR